MAYFIQNNFVQNNFVQNNLNKNDLNKYRGASYFYRKRKRT